MKGFKVKNKLRKICYCALFILITSALMPPGISLNTNTEAVTVSTEIFEGNVQNKQSSEHSIQIDSESTYVEIKLEWSGSADLDLRVTDNNGKRTGGFSSKLYEISGSTYSGWTVNPETVKISNPTSGTWTIAVFAYTGSGSYKITVDQTQPYGEVNVNNWVETSDPQTQTFTDTIHIKKTTGDTHTFQVYSTTSNVKITLEMPTGVDFDLRVTDSNGKRTGGFTSSINEITNAEYSGWTSKPETVEVSSPSEGTWSVVVFSYSGTGTYTVTVEKTSSNNNPNNGGSSITYPQIEYIKVENIAQSDDISYFEVVVGMPDDADADAATIRSNGQNMGYTITTDFPEKFTINVPSGYAIVYTLPVNIPTTTTVKLIAWAGSQLLSSIDLAGVSYLVDLGKILAEHGNCNKVQLTGSNTGRYLIKTEKTGYTTNDLSLEVNINLAYSQNSYYTGTQTTASAIQALTSYSYSIDISE